MIAAPDHLAPRGMKSSVGPREPHADEETKARPHAALPMLPAVPLGLRQWNKGSSRDVSPHMSCCGTIAACPMCAPLYGGMSLERRGQPAAMISPGPCIPYLIADRVGGVQLYGTWAQLLPRSLGAKPHVAKYEFPTHEVDEAFVDSGSVMEGTQGAFGACMVSRRARPIPSHVALEPFDPEHVSVPTHRWKRASVADLHYALSLRIT